MKNFAYTVMVACLAAMTMASCKHNNQPDPQPADPAPHWAVSMPEASCNWQAPVRDHEPVFMTIVSSLPSVDQRSADDRMAVLTMKDSVLSLIGVDPTDECGQFYVVKPTDSDDNIFRLCFYSAVERQFYATACTGESDSTNTFSNYASIGSFAKPFAPGWTACGPYTYCVPVCVSTESLTGNDELALFVGGECRTVSYSNVETSGETAVYTFMLPIASLSNAEVEARLYRAADKKISTKTVQFNYGSLTFIVF